MKIVTGGVWDELVCLQVRELLLFTLVVWENDF